MAVGADENDSNGDMSGHVRVFEYDAVLKDWFQMGVDLEGTAAGDGLGDSVALSADGTVLAVGAPGNDGKGNLSGLVRVFQYNRGRAQWNQLGDLHGKNPTKIINEFNQIEFRFDKPVLARFRFTDD